MELAEHHLIVNVFGINLRKLLLFAENHDLV